MKKVWKNIKTTLFGCFAGLPQIVTGIKTGDFVMVFTGASTLFMGLFAKDYNSNEHHN
jgi:hypothetical protein